MKKALESSRAEGLLVGREVPGRGKIKTIGKYSGTVRIITFEDGTTMPVSKDRVKSFVDVALRTEAAGKIQARPGAVRAQPSQKITNFNELYLKMQKGANASKG